MSLSIYALVWVVYLATAGIFFRCFVSPYVDSWFPNSARTARILVLVVLLSPALMADEGSFYLAPSLMALLFQALAKSPLGMLKAILPWLLFGGLVLWVDAVLQRGRTPRDVTAPPLTPTGRREPTL